MSDDRSAVLAGKLLADTIATFELMGTYLGVRLGLYAALDTGPATARELASRAGVDARYAREWLEQQAVAGAVRVDDAASPADDRIYVLPAGHREVLVDQSNASYLAPLAFVCSIGGLLPRLIEAYRDGTGVPFSAYGTDMLDHIEQLNRPMFDGGLASEWIPAVPGLRERLLAEPPARVLDLACGAGASSIALARGFPAVQVDALDLDAASIAKAKATAETAGVGDRVQFDVGDAATMVSSSRYDLVMIFEALHDMARPVPALEAARRALVPGGSVLIGDEKVAERFVAPGDELERLMYGFSIVHCLPAARTEHDSAATGTMLRPDTLRRYARDAGFGAVDVLPVEHDMWRFYVLRQS